MKRIVVELSGMPFDPTYEIDDQGCPASSTVVAAALITPLRTTWRR
jgi:hypothetical protein